MIINDLKSLINSGDVPKQFLIFKYEDTDYLSMDYIKAISNIKNKDYIVLSSIEDIPKPNPFIADDNMYVVKVDSIDVLPQTIGENIYFLTKKLSKSALTQYESNIIMVPKVEKWQSEAYIDVKCPGLSKEIISWFVENYDNDLYKIMLELDKVMLFPPDTRKYIFEEFYRDGLFDSGSDSQATFKLSNAIQSRDLPTINQLLSQDVEPMALLSLLYSNFTKLIKVWLSKNPTQEDTGLKSNQIWAIGKLPRTYNKDQLIKALHIISSMDNGVKSGEFPIELMNDYLVTRLLTI